MANLNKVMLIGNLTADPEPRTTPRGTALTELRIAVNRMAPGPNEGRLQMDTWEDRQTGQKRSRIRIVAENLQLLSGGRSEGGSSAPSSGSYSSYRQQSQPQQPAAPSTTPAPMPMDDDDDIPF